MIEQRPFGYSGTRLVILIIGTLTVALFGWLIGSWLIRPSVPVPGAFQPPEMAAAQFASRDVIGDLGGMPVKIPRHFAHYVEYDGDPSWGEQRTGAPPLRTPASRLKSFGFDVRFPDMRGLDSPEMYVDKRKTPASRTYWIGVGVTTGSYYPGDGFLDRQLKAMNSPGSLFQYGQVGDSENGLLLYAPTGHDPITQQPNRTRDNAEDIYVHRGADGAVKAYISCSNRPHRASTCRHSFQMGSGVQAEINVRYRREMLPQWSEIQSAVSEVIADFRFR